MNNYELVGPGELVVGKETSIGKGTKFIFRGPGTVTLGDYVAIGDNVKVIVESGSVSIDDWTTLHPDTLVLSKVGVSIGQHCWFGQNTILDGTGGLRIGNGVRVGMYSQIWSHIAAGEQIEGCLFFSADPVEIEDDVWLVGSCTVGSNVRIGRRSVCLSGSNVTKSLPQNIVAAGSPAKVKESIKAYCDITLEQKFAMMLSWSDEFCSNSNGRFESAGNRADIIEIHSSQDGALHIFKHRADYFGFDAPANCGKMCVESKTYSKSFLPLEAVFMRYLSGNKARFYRDTHTSCNLTYGDAIEVPSAL